MQVLQAANTGISSLQKLVNNAKSVANQALQTQVGYSQKSTVTSAAITGATASNLLGDYVSVAKVGTGAVNNRLSTPVAITSATTLVGGANTDTILATGALTTSDTITVNGTTISFTSGRHRYLGRRPDVRLDESIGSLLGKIDAITGGATYGIAAGVVTLNTGTTSDLSITGTTGGYALLAGLNLTTGTTAISVARDNQLSPGLTLTIGATGDGTATSITFGHGANQVDTLDELNAAISANNLQATIATNGAITITTSNDAASSTIGTIGGTAAGSGEAFNGVSVSAPVQDAAAQLTRAGLVSPVQRDHPPDRQRRPGCVVCRCEPAGPRYAEAGVQRDRHSRRSPSRA